MYISKLLINAFGMKKPSLYLFSNSKSLFILTGFCIQKFNRTSRVYDLNLRFLIVLEYNLDEFENNYCYLLSEGTFGLRTSFSMPLMCTCMPL